VRIVCTIEESGQKLTVREDRGRYDVILGNVVLLSSAALETERAFGRLARGARSVVIGGLGFGATLAGALEVVASDARVVVVEKLAAIETLLRGELAHVAACVPEMGSFAPQTPGGDPRRPPRRSVLLDPRVTIVRDDVADVIARERDLDAILLDVDNGPDWASFRSNARLYGKHGLECARAALAAHGILAVWSGYPADGFLAKLRAANLVASVVRLEERGVVRARAYIGKKA
jgi:hypothetical protein